MNSFPGIFLSLSAAAFAMLSTGCNADNRESADCDPSSIFLISAQTSPKIGTVGIIEWSTSIDPVSSASIEFGLDTDYGYKAPVDLNEPHFRTMLLGMKPSKIYHFRIVVDSCKGADHTIETGSQPTDLPSKTVAVADEESSAKGFIITSTGAMVSDYAYILDKDGDYVWWYSFGADKIDNISRAKMSADGKFMWAGTLNMDCGCGYLFKISMDGQGEQETYSYNRHHDFTVLPDNTVASIEYADSSGSGDVIVEHSENGETRTVYSLSNDFPGSGYDWSHCNAIHYYPSDDSYTISCDNLNNIIKIDRESGSLLWNLKNDSTGDFSGVSWIGQHGHQLLDNKNILIFSNQGSIADQTGVSESANGGSIFVGGSETLELSLDLSERKSSTVWSYKEETTSAALGDVQRIALGNTLITYTMAGEIREVSPSKKIIRSISVNGLGYSDWRPTLYGPPYRY